MSLDARIVIITLKNFSKSPKVIKRSPVQNAKAIIQKRYFRFLEHRALVEVQVPVILHLPVAVQDLGEP